MYSQLGNIVFEGLIGYNTLNEKIEANYAEHGLIDRSPKLQKIGDKLQVIDFEIVFHASFCDPEQEIDNLKNACTNGDILPFINGNGRIFGDFVVLSVGTSTTQTDKIGNIISATISISLLEVVEDKLTQKVNEAKRRAVASIDNSPSKTTIVNRSQGEASSIMQSMGEARNATKQADENISKAKRFSNASAHYLAKAQKGLRKGNEALQAVVLKLTLAQHTYQSKERIKSAAATTMSYIGTAYEAAQTGDVDGALLASANMQAAMNRTNGATAEVAALAACKIT